MTVTVTARHLDVCRGTLSCPVTLALRELLPGHTVHIGGACAHIDGAPVHLPAAVFDWCDDWDRGRKVEPFSFEFDPTPNARRPLPAVWCGRCPAIGVPGYTGGDSPDLCSRCETFQPQPVRREPQCSY